MDKKWWSKKSAAMEIGRWMSNIRIPGLKSRTADSGGDETYQRQLNELLKQIERARMLRQ